MGLEGYPGCRRCLELHSAGLSLRFISLFLSFCTPRHSALPGHPHQCLWWHGEHLEGGWDRPKGSGSTGRRQSWAVKVAPLLTGPWRSYLTSEHLSFLISNLEVKVFTLKGCWGIWNDGFQVQGDLEAISILPKYKQTTAQLHGHVQYGQQGQLSHGDWDGSSMQGRHAWLAGGLGAPARSDKGLPQAVLTHAAPALCSRRTRENLLWPFFTVVPFSVVCFDFLPLCVAVWPWSWPWNFSLNIISWKGTAIPHEAQLQRGFSPPRPLCGSFLF